MIDALLIGIVLANIVGGILLISGGWIIGVFNTFAKAKQDILGQIGDLAAEYQRRADLLVNLWSSVKNIGKLEKEMIENVTAARSGILSEKTANGKVKHVKALDKAYGLLEMRTENYPEIRSTEAYKEFRDELRGTENVVLDQRKKYNAITQDINSYMNQFPTILLKGVFKQTDYEFFVVENAEVKVFPKINYEA